jgi:integrase
MLWYTPGTKEVPMATIVTRKNADGKTVYKAVVRRKGVPTQTATFAKRSDAQDWAVKAEGAIVERRYFPQRAAQNHTLTDAIDRYLKETLPDSKPGTATKRKQVLGWWKTRLGAMRLSDVTTDQILTVRTELRQTFKATSANTYISHLSACLTRAAIVWKWIPASPLWKVPRLPGKSERCRYLSRDERVRLLEACKQSRSPHLYPIVFLAISTGARRGELLNLMWADVDFDRHTLTFWNTKNGEHRVVAVTGPAVQILQEQYNRWSSESTYVFPGLKGRGLRPFYETWDTARKRAKIVDFRFHDLRHTCASYLAMNGATLIEIAAVLGHKNIQETHRYAHLTQDHTHGVLEKMTRAVFTEREEVSRTQ